MAKNKILVKPTPAVVLLDEQTQTWIALYWKVVLSVWYSSHDLPPDEALSKKKEVIGWACSAARLVGEGHAAQGVNLADCLTRAAEELLAKAKKLEG